MGNRLWPNLTRLTIFAALTFCDGAHGVDVDQYITQDDVLTLWNLVQKEGVTAGEHDFGRSVAHLATITEKEKYNETTAQHALYYSGLAYCDDIKDCDHTGSTAATNASVELENVEKVYDSSTEHQAFVGYNNAHDRVVITFRGTATLSNWISNLNMSLCATTFHPISTRAKPLPNARETVHVHCGFLTAFRNLMKQGVLRAAMKLLYLHPTSSLLLTGHSLGGNLALLAATEFAGIISEEMPLSRQHDVMLYTFAASFVGGTNFAEHFHVRVSPRLSASYRVVFGKDPIPNFPMSKPDRQYQHVGTEVWYSAPSLREETHSHSNSRPSLIAGRSGTRSLRSLAFQDFKICDGSGTDPLCSMSVPALDSFRNWRHHEYYSYVAALHG